MFLSKKTNKYKENRFIVENEKHLYLIIYYHCILQRNQNSYKYKENSFIVENEKQAF